MMRPIQLRMARAALNWTVRELAERADVNKNTISRYEAGNDIVSGSLSRIERVLAEEGVKFFEENPDFGVGVGFRLNNQVTKAERKRSKSSGRR